ncbi:MAG: CBS domain-containing protein, partial [Thermodesulfovibrionales bacterium]|nr:CBS domain-containing protein [Thermodesulfovibrionales bacterium]
YCRSTVCNLGLFVIVEEECILCGLCKEACAFDAVKETRRSFFIDRDYCTRCKACYTVCPTNAVKIVRTMFERLEEELEIPIERLEVIEKRRRTALKDILETKPSEILSIHKDRTITDAVRIMTEKNVSGVFVVDDNNSLLSLFTERDIAQAVFQGISFDQTLWSIVQMRQIITFDPSAEISTAISIASRNKIRHLPVVEEGRIIGMITFRDLVSYLLPEIFYMATRE